MLGSPSSDWGMVLHAQRSVFCCLLLEGLTGVFRDAPLALIPSLEHA